MINVFYCDSENAAPYYIENLNYKYDKVTFTADGKGIFSNTNSSVTQIFYWTVTDRNNFNESTQLYNSDFENTKVLKLTVKDKHYCFSLYVASTSYDEECDWICLEDPFNNFIDLELRCNDLCTIARY